MDLEHSTPRKPLRLWPGVLVVVLQWLLMFGLPIVVPEQGGTAMIGGVVCGLAAVIWWLFFSRAAWSERLGAIVLMVVAVAATTRLVHESIANGMMGFMVFLYAVPVLSLALVAWAAASRGLSSGRSTRVDGRRNSARVRNVDACPDQRCHWQRQFGFRMAVDANVGATAPCAGRRRASRAPVHVASFEHARESLPESAQRGGDDSHVGSASRGDS